MKTISTIIAFAVMLLVAPSPCFALTLTVNVSTERAKELGMELDGLRNVMLQAWEPQPGGTLTIPRVKFDKKLALPAQYRIEGGQRGGSREK